MLTFTSSVNYKNNSTINHHKHKKKEYKSICFFCCF